MCALMGERKKINKTKFHQNTGADLARDLHKCSSNINSIKGTHRRRILLQYTKKRLIHEIKEKQESNRKI